MYLKTHHPKEKIKRPENTFTTNKISTAKAKKKKKNTYSSLAANMSQCLGKEMCLLYTILFTTKLSQSALQSN